MTHSVAYRLFWEFHACFYGVSNVLFLIFLWRAFAILGRAADPKWGVHRQWLGPMLICAAIGVYYRTFYNIHYFFKINLGDFLTYFDSTALMVGDIFGLVGGYRLFRVLRKLVPAMSLANLPIEAWPPRPGSDQSDPTLPVA